MKDDNDDVFDLSAFGMTRCGAAHSLICLQRHQDGAFYYGDGEDYHRKFFLGLNPLNRCDDPIFYTEDKPEHLAVCTAVSVLGKGYGAAMIVEDVGLV